MVTLSFVDEVTGERIGEVQADAVPTFVYGAAASEYSRYAIVGMTVKSSHFCEIRCRKVS